MNETIENRTYTVTEVADLIGVSRLTMWRWVNGGEVAKCDLPGIIRIPYTEVKRLVDAKNGA